MLLFKRKDGKSILPTKSARERMIFENLVDPDRCVDLATELLNGNPICVGYENLDVDEANKNIAFLSGVIFAIDGVIKQLNDTAFLYARKEEFMDGTLNEFLKEFC